VSHLYAANFSCANGFGGGGTLAMMRSTAWSADRPSDSA
jgi:hypothetical protein